MLFARTVFVVLVFAFFVKGEESNLRGAPRQRDRDLNGGPCPCWGEKQLRDMFDYPGWIERAPNSCKENTNSPTQVILNYCSGIRCNLAVALTGQNSPECRFAEDGGAEMKMDIEPKEAKRCVQSIARICKKLGKPIEGL